MGDEDRSFAFAINRKTGNGNGNDRGDLGVDGIWPARDILPYQYQKLEPFPGKQKRAAGSVHHIV